MSFVQFTILPLLEKYYSKNYLFLCTFDIKHRSLQTLGNSHENSQSHQLVSVTPFNHSLTEYHSKLTVMKCNQDTYSIDHVVSLMSFSSSFN